MSKLLNTRQASEVLGLSPSSLEHWRTLKKGPPFVRVGTRCIRYRVDDLDAWLNEQLINTH